MVMDPIGWIIVVGLLAAAGGFLTARATGAGRKANELQTQLDASRNELESKQIELDKYRNEVFEQFGATAQKFKTLNDSYHDLHRQLAKSASVLCGEVEANALLEAPPSEAIAYDRQAAAGGDESMGGGEVAGEAEVAGGAEVAGKAEVVGEHAFIDDIDAIMDEVPVVAEVDKRPVQPTEVPTLNISQAFDAVHVDDAAADEQSADIIVEEIAESGNQTPRKPDADALPIRSAG